MNHNFRWVKGGSRDSRKGYHIWFDYDPDVINQIKETIPGYLREWYPDEKYWWISELCEKQLNDTFPGFIEAVIAQKTLF